MGSSPSPPALGTWAAPTRRVKISLTARTAPSARSGRESRAAIEGIEDDRDRPPGAGRSGGFTGEATVRADEGIHRETELGERLGVREESPSVPGMKTCTELRLPVMLDTVPRFQRGRSPYAWTQARCVDYRLSGHLRIGTNRTQRCIALVSSSACPNCSGNCCRPAARRHRFPARVRRLHDLANLSTVSPVWARRIAR